MSDDEALRCPECGVRRMYQTVLISAADGNAMVGDDVVVCVACSRAYYVDVEGEKPQLRIALRNVSIPTWRTL